MTLNKFIKDLQKLQAKGYGKAHVCIKTQEVQEKRNDDFSHENVNQIDVNVIVYSIDDNPFLADGTERLRTVVELGI